MAQLAQAGQLGLAHPPPDAIHTPVTTAEAHLQALADVEDQCASHGRHPAEWDGISQGWISTHEPAQPYAIINTSLDPPRRSREVMCELLAAGLPISRTAHQSINNAVDQKRVVKATRKLVLEGRSPHGLTPHVSAAAALGILQPHHRDFYLAVQDHLEKEELPTAAYDAVASAMPGTVGTVTMAMLESWLTALPEDAYITQLKAGREVLKITRSPGDAAAAVQPATDLAIGTVAVKTAQFLEGLYFQEVKQAKLRRSQGHPPAPLRAQAESGLPSSAALGAAASTSSAGASSAGASSLPWLPQGCTWGYRTPEGFFVAFDPSTGAAGEPTRVVQKNALHAFPETEDEELRQLAHVYQPVLWAPDKAEAAQRCWQHYAADRPGVVHDDRLAKEASSEKNAIVRQELRVEHFGKKAERQLLRDVALVVQERIRKGVFVPTGCEAKALDSLKLKILVLQLPERDASLPPPLQRLLAIEYNGPVISGKTGGKKRKVRPI